MENIVEIKEDVKIKQEDHNIVLESGDRIKILKEDFSLSNISYESLIRFFGEEVTDIPNFYRQTKDQFVLKSRSEKIQVDFLINFRSLDVYSPREDIYSSFYYKDIKEIAINSYGFVVISKSGSFLIRVHL